MLKRLFLATVMLATTARPADRDITLRLTGILFQSSGKQGSVLMMVGKPDQNGDVIASPMLTTSFRVRPSTVLPEGTNLLYCRVTNEDLACSTQ